MIKKLIVFLSILSLSISFTSCASESMPTDVTAESMPTDVTADCKLPVADGRGDVSIGGWPRIDKRLKSTGDVIATVVMVDFPDAPATMTPADAFARISPAADVFKEMSYGKLNYTFKPQLKWYRMSKNSSNYVVGGWTFNKHRDYITEAAKLADADTDFSKTDSLIILANPDAKGIGYSGPAFAAIRKSVLPSMVNTFLMAQPRPMI